MIDKFKEKMTSVVYNVMNNLLYYTKGAKMVANYTVPCLIHKLELGEEGELKQMVDLSSLESEGIAVLQESISPSALIEKIKSCGYDVVDADKVAEVAERLWEKPDIKYNVMLMRMKYKGKRGSKPIERWEIF